ncbi:SDR family oxidoreductase [Vreelandella populi]|uniref:SDR family oxidoreductase n=1 Tax=Vreelandella populi TaxID=2498858 RepID=UPI000F8DB17A|nr:SDR family oxidoreductase [Halomonas populi]RUR51690.1 SDR family oxidoreductase [Halomonas populi]
MATELTSALTQNSERSAELASLALFLASPSANVITGILLPVDGGYSSRQDGISNKKE